MLAFKSVKPRKTAVKESVGERGKYAEKQVRDLFDKLNTENSSFAYERVVDARAARGAVGKALSDFLVWSNPYNIPLEVKSTLHKLRLPSSAITQLPRLKKVAMAGAKPYVLVYFKTLDAWRVAPASWFEFGVPSWDMSELPTHPTCEQALFSTGYFPRLRNGA